ncbi:MAG: GTP cyclohydrolase II [Acidobacteriota bacterium]
MKHIQFKRVPESILPTRFGEFRILGFQEEAGGEEAIALCCGDVAASESPLVRIHSQCLTGDVFGSLRCDCGEQLRRALEQIQAAGCGALIYQMQEGRGIGLINKLYAYELQDGGMDTVEANEKLGFSADQRDYLFCAEILRQLGIRQVELMSNNPEKIAGLERAGIRVTLRVPREVAPSESTARYLKTKKERLGHLLE